MTAAGSACCAPSKSAACLEVSEVSAAASRELIEDVAATLISLSGGFFEMGGRQSCHAADMDSPRRKIRAQPSRLARTTVTNALFERFVAETGYRTTAEIEGSSFVFYKHLDQPERFSTPSPLTPWWRDVPGASWRTPEGSGSDIKARGDHPVVHVSHHDVRAFCAATGTRLPTEVEWEYAARGGLRGKKYPWGSAPDGDVKLRHNVWRGSFPYGTADKDNLARPVPVTTFAPNPLGFFNMTGNVWEWCADTWGPLPQTRRSETYPASHAHVIRGGSFLCHASYCERYYVHSRTSNTANSSTCHMGFRVAADWS